MGDRRRIWYLAGLVITVIAIGWLAADSAVEAGCGRCGGGGQGHGHGPAADDRTCGGGAGECGRERGGGCGAGQRAGHGGGRGKGHGAGHGGHQGANHHDTIHALLGEHESIERHVELVDGGVETTTTSDDPEVARMIREHVVQMKGRMESGHGMRWWDPTFAELFRRHDEVRMEIEEIEGGVRVRELSDDPEVVTLIRHHATRAVSEFVSGGFERAPRPTPLPEGYAAD